MNLKKHMMANKTDIISVVKGEEKSKPLSARLQEVANIYTQMKEFGLDQTVCEKIGEFKQIANVFVKEGYSQSGKMYLREIDRYLVYVLSMQPHIVSYAKLVVPSTIKYTKT